MHFEFWDLESRNLLYDFDTLGEAIDAARELTACNPGRYPGNMALFRSDGEKTSAWIERGEDLLALSERQTAV